VVDYPLPKKEKFLPVSGKVLQSTSTRLFYDKED
jgi:hypothetical protein